MEFCPKLRHQRSQSEIVINDLKQFKTLKRPRSVSQLQATSINRLYKVAGCENLQVSPVGRPRSWTWHGRDSEPDLGQFLVEEASREKATLKSYSQESILDDSNDYNCNSPRNLPLAAGLKTEKEAVKNIISDVLVTEFLNGHYDADVAMEQCALVSQRIEAAVRSMLDSEVRVVATVHMGEQRGQAVEISCQCLWDPENDNLVTVSFQDQALFAICTVFIVHT